MMALCKGEKERSINYLVKSIYFGGGTPSLAKPELVRKVLEVVTSAPGVHLDPQCEVTLEINPSGVDPSKLREFKDAGVNRISVGIQSLRPHVLELFGRDHSVEEGLDTIKEVAKVFDNVSSDFIWGYPGQTVDDWKKDLVFVTQQLGVGHLSLYQLTYERGTPLYSRTLKRQNRDKQKLPKNIVIDDDEHNRLADLYDITMEECANGGFEQYEVSSFCRKRTEDVDDVDHRGKHNMSIWSGSPFIGVGPGAAGRVDLSHGATAPHVRFRTHRINAPAHYIRQVRQHGHGHAANSPSKMLRIEEIAERLTLGLRTYAGFDCSAFEEAEVEQVVDVGMVDAFVKNGLLTVTRNGGTRSMIIQPTVRGLAVIDGVLAQILRV
ncbi:radical S-adenosyl methionine domain-containing protein 1 [Gaertneriomyces sp. JEL0708]|nr:radical S-adenosyl methionine domain-containing protein 1 [Gaertneriomyces sp. JEL0708]